jgi:hypothetical protein
VTIAIWCLLIDGISKLLLCTNAATTSIKDAQLETIMSAPNASMSMTIFVSAIYFINFYFIEKIISSRSNTIGIRGRPSLEKQKSTSGRSSKTTNPATSDSD